MEDQALLKQKSTKTRPPYDPKPFTITEVNGHQITAERGDTTRTRDAQKWKGIKTKLNTSTSGYEDGSDDEWWDASDVMPSAETSTAKRREPAPPPKASNIPPERPALMESAPADIHKRTLRSHGKNLQWNPSMGAKETILEETSRTSGIHQQ